MDHLFAHDRQLRITAFGCRNYHFVIKYHYFICTGEIFTSTYRRGVKGAAWSPVKMQNVDEISCLPSWAPSSHCWIALYSTGSFSLLHFPCVDNPFQFHRVLLNWIKLLWSRFQTASMTVLQKCNVLLNIFWKAFLFFGLIFYLSSKLYRLHLNQWYYDTKGYYWD